MRHAMIDFLEAHGNPRMKLDFKPVRYESYILTIICQLFGLPFILCSEINFIFYCFVLSTKMSDKYSEESQLPKPLALVFESNSSYVGKEVNLSQLLYYFSKEYRLG